MNNNTIVYVTLLSLITFTSFGQDKKFTGYATSTVTSSAISIETVGFADKDNLQKYDSLSIQPIGSISKTFIGLSLMIAKEQGLIDLDTDINTYLDFKVINPHMDKNNVITLRHLATHTSGIKDTKYYYKAYSKSTSPEMALGEYLKKYLVEGLDYNSKKNYAKSKSGTRYEYSNVAATLAAYVLEKATGIPFHEFTKQHILAPLGMKDSGWFYSDIDQSHHAKLYDEKDKVLQPYSLITYPDGNFKTSIRDLSIYLQALMKGYHRKSDLLSAVSWDELYRKNFSEENPIENINPREPNSGIFIAYSKSGKIGHTGSDPGVVAIMWFSTNTNEGHIFMANEDLTKKNIDSFKNIWKDLSNN